MRQSQINSHSPVYQYRLHGDERPTKKRLESYANKLSDRKKPATLIVVADMLTDLAMRDPKRADVYLAAANAKLALAAQRASQQPGLARLAIKARSRRAELAAWGQAARGQDITMPYQKLLSAAAAATYYPEHGNDVRKPRKQAIVPLLGAWGLEQGINGWIGRSALTREGGRLHESDGEDWDCGVMLSTEADKFDNPPIKLHLDDIGVNDPLRIIYSHLDKVDCLPDHANPDRVLSTAALERINGNLFVAILSNISR